jgi:hypothetical protein
LILSTLVCEFAHAQGPTAFHATNFEAGAVSVQPMSNLAQSYPSSDASLIAETPLDLRSPVSLVAAGAGDFSVYVRSPEFSAEPSSSSAASRPAAFPEPKPQPYYYDEFPKRWELGLAFALVRFRSSVYYATAPGLNSSLSYWVKDWVAIEGAVTTAFAPPVFENEHFRYLGYGAGPKFSFGRDQRLQPWAHALIGGVHLIPQTASSGRNGFEVTMGGGINYKINDVLAAKVGLDYLGTHMFSSYQNSFQVVAGFALRF